MPPHLGKYAQEKTDQAVRMADSARNAGFIVDVSTRVEDSLVGDAWPQFLRQCKFTVGMKGGASIADPYGLLYNKVESYRHRHPDSTLTTEMFYFLNRRDKKYKFSAISPRLFEAAAEGVCQILRPDDYLGVLEPGQHHIPLNSDFSNINAVLAAIQGIEMCQQIADNANRTLVRSGEFSYQHLVFAATLGMDFSRGQDREISAWENMKKYLNRSSILLRQRLFNLHDAALYLAHESLANPQLGRLNSGHYVQNKLQQYGYSDGYLEISEAMQNDSLAWRSPWIWRAI